MQFPASSHLSDVVQPSPSVQVLSLAAPSALPAQVPPVQTSPSVQALPSVHEAPSAFGVPLQVPPTQLSELVQSSLSLQLEPSLFVSFLQAPVLLSQESVVQGLPSLQSLLSPVQ